MNTATAESITRLKNQRQIIKKAINELKALRTYLKSEIGTRAVIRETRKANSRKPKSAHGKNLTEFLPGLQKAFKSILNLKSIKNE
jgi:hypothetical protein